MAEQNSNFITELWSVDGKPKMEKFLSEDTDSVHSAMTLDASSGTNNIMKNEEQREIIGIKNDRQQATAKDESSAPDIIIISDESSIATSSSNYNSDSSSDLEKVTVKVTTISHESSHRKKIQKKKVTTIRTHRRVDCRHITNKKVPIPLRADDLNNKSAGAEKASTLIREGLKKITEQDKNRRQATKKNEKPIDKDFKPFTNTKDSNFFEKLNFRKNSNTSASPGNIDDIEENIKIESANVNELSSSLHEETKRSTEQDKNQRQVPSENNKAQEVLFKIENDLKPFTKVEHSYLVKEMDDEVNFGSLKSRKENFEQSEREIHTLDDEESIYMNVSGSSENVTPQSIKIIKEEKKYSAFGVAHFSGTNYRGSAKSRLFADNLNIGCRRKIEFKVKEPQDNCPKIGETRGKVSADYQEIIALSDSDDEDNSFHKRPSQNQSLNSENFGKNSEERKKIDHTSREDDAQFSRQEKTTEAIECNYDYKESDFNKPVEKRNNNVTRARFAVEENGVCRDLIRSGYYNNISVVKSTSGQCFNSEKSVHNKIIPEKNPSDCKRDKQKSAEKKETSEKKSGKRLLNDISTSDEETLRGVKRACTEKKSIADDRLNKEDRLHDDKRVYIERWLHDNRYYTENLSFNDDPADDRNRRHEEMRTRDKNSVSGGKSCVERRQRMQAQREKRFREEKQAVDRNRTDNEHRFSQVNRSADENRTANANRCAQEKGCPQKNRIANENLFQPENRIANENRFPQENEFADKEQMVNENRLATENRSAIENRTVAESIFLQENRSADINDFSKIGTLNSMKSVEKKYSEFGVMNVSVFDNGGFVKSQLFSANSGTERRLKMEIKDKKGKDIIEEIEESIEAVEDIIVLSDSDVEDDLSYKRSLQDELLGENRQTFTQNSANSKKVTVTYRKDDAQLSPNGKPEQEFSKAISSSGCDNNNGQRDSNERRNEDTEKRNGTVSRPRFVVQQNGNCIDLVYTGRKWWNNYVSEPKVDRTIKKDKKFFDNKKARERVKSKNHKTSHKRPYKEFPHERKFVAEKRARVEKKSLNEDHCSKREKVHDKKDVDEKHSLQKEFSESKRSREENSSNDCEILRDLERIDLERSLYDDCERDFFENLLSSDKRTDEIDRRHGKSLLHDEEILRELKRIHDEPESHQKSVREENRAHEEKSVREENRAHEEKTVREENRAHEKKSVREENRAHEEKSVREENRAHEEKSVREENRAHEEKTVREENRAHEKKSVREENRAHEEKSVREENRAHEEKSVRKENRAHEEKSVREENRAHEEKSVREENRTHEEKSVREENRAHEEKSVREKNRAHEEKSVREENRAHEMESVREENRAHGKKSVAEENRAHGERSFGEENRTHSEKTFREDKRSASEKRSDKKRHEKTRLSDDAISRELERIDDEESVREENRARPEKRFREDDRLGRGKQLDKERQCSGEKRSSEKKRSVESKRSAEEKRSFECKKSAKEKRFAESERLTEEPQSTENNRSAEEKKSVEKKRSVEEKQAAEDRHFPDKSGFRGFDFSRDENQADQMRFPEEKRSNHIDRKSPHRISPDDRENVENTDNKTKSHKHDSEEDENRQQNPAKLPDNDGTPNHDRTVNDPRLKPNSHPIVLIRKLGQIKKPVPIVEPHFFPQGNRRASCSNIVNRNKSVDKNEANAASSSTSQCPQFTTRDYTKEKEEEEKNQPKNSTPELSERDFARKNTIERKFYVKHRRWRRIKNPWAIDLPISSQPSAHLTSEERENIRAIRRKQLREIAEQHKDPTSEKSATISVAVSEADEEPSSKRDVAQRAKVTEEPRGYFLFSKPIEKRAKKQPEIFEQSPVGKKSEKKTNADDEAIDSSDGSEDGTEDQNLETQNSDDIVVPENVAKKAKIEQGKTCKSKRRTILVSETRKTSGFAKTVRHVSFDDSATVIREFQIEPEHKMRKFGLKDLDRWQQPSKNNDENLQTVRGYKIYPKMEEFLAQIFQWNPRWLEEQIEIKAPPPIVDESKLTAMLPYYRTYEEYYNIAEPLLTLEMWYGISRDFEVGKTHQNFFSIVSNSINVIPIYFTNVEVSTLILEVVVSKRELQLQAHPVYGDLLFFEYHSNRPDERGYGSWEVFAYVTSLRKTPITSLTNLNRDLINAVKEPHTLLTYTVMTKALDYTDVQTNRVNRLRTISYLRSNMRMVQALQNLPESPLMNIILHPKVEDYQLPAENNVEAYPLVTKDSLNAKQLEAVVKITNAVVRKLPKVCLIQGPPGTGKSRVIVNLITQILYGDDRYHSDKKLRILVCAPSNAAVDEIVLRLLHVQKSFEEENRFNVVRTGITETIHPSAKVVSLRELAKKRVEERANSFSSSSINDHEDECERLNRRNAKIYREAQEELLKEADVVASTLTSCYTNQMELIFGENAESISVCIVDEATQCAEAENLIPLMLGVRTLVLVGDTNQLPATVLSQKAKQFGLDQSLFARIWRVFKDEINNPIIQLNTQYRMTVPVSHFPNKYFYGGALINAARMRKLPFHSYRVINLDSTQDVNKFSNVDEADFIANLVYMMIARTSYDDAVLPVKVGIITPYNSQKILLRRRINERVLRLKDKNRIAYEVNTVDSFQGQERDVIIMSCVRSSGIGFLSDRQRLCVALTRAKHSLILCGNFRTFHRDPMWKALLSDARSRNVYLNLKSKTNPGDIRSHIIR